MSPPGLKNTRVISPTWQEHHMPTVEQTLLFSEVQLIRPEIDGIRDKETGKTGFLNSIYWQGDARIQLMGINRAETYDRADKVTTKGSYLVALPKASLTVLVRDLVKVLRCDGQPGMVGLMFQVVDVEVASLTWERDLGCDLYQPTVR